jgi:ribosomal protein S27E
MEAFDMNYYERYFENIDLGKWQLRELAGGLWEVRCPKCGHRHSIFFEEDPWAFKCKVVGLVAICPECHENMFQSELEISTNETGFTVNTTDPNSIVISCERITLAQNSIGIELDISKNIETVEVIEINGIKFRRETI